MWCGAEPICDQVSGAFPMRAATVDRAVREAGAAVSHPRPYPARDARAPRGGCACP